ncbi:MAG: hypothetical protein QOH95_634, partial [Gaiellaceae bacterium]|nr:hypothetical protein [Gaiellaceae bacterium]
MRGIPESPSPPVASPEPTLQPLDPRLSAVSIAFAAFAVLLVAAGISLLAEVGLLGRLKDGGPVTRSQLAASDDRQALFAVLVLIAYIVAGI